MPALLPSELPEIARTGHHWIVLFHPPPRWAAIGVLLLLIWALIAPLMWIVLLVLLGAAALQRWRIWRAELIILTTRRIVRTQGVPETTISEASLRLDRVSGTRLTQTVFGKLLKYATIEIAAPGDHPEVHKLDKIREPITFYSALRKIVYSGGAKPDPDDSPRGAGPAPSDGPPPSDGPTPSGGGPSSGDAATPRDAATPQDATLSPDSVTERFPRSPG